MAGTTTTSILRLPSTRESGDSGESARTLDRIVETAETIKGLRADEIEPGDWVVIRTKNSKYSLAAMGNGVYRISGGWFAAHGEENRDVRISGCTWGGAVIHTRLVAAVGMFLEFDNGVRTTRIHEVTLIRGGDDRKH